MMRKKYKTICEKGLGKAEPDFEHQNRTDLSHHSATVNCPVCKGVDNDWRIRCGLCLDCYSFIVNRLLKTGKKFTAVCKLIKSYNWNDNANNQKSPDFMQNIHKALKEYNRSVIKSGTGGFTHIATMGFIAGGLQYTEDKIKEYSTLSKAERLKKVQKIMEKADCLRRGNEIKAAQNIEQNILYLLYGKAYSTRIGYQNANKEDGIMYSELSQNVRDLYTKLLDRFRRRKIYHSKTKEKTKCSTTTI